MELMAFVHASVAYEDLTPTPQLRSVEEMGTAVTQSAGVGLAGVVAAVSILTSSTNALALVQSGDSGTDVREVQTALVESGFDLGEIDGVFGPATESAVVQFQRSHNLEADGIVGPQTLAALGLGETASASATSPATPRPGTTTASPTASTPTATPGSGTTATTAPGIILTTESTTTPTTTSTPRSAVVNAAGGLTVRANPGLDSTAIAIKPDGARISLTGQEMRLDGYTWVRLAGEPGWVASQYLAAASSSTSSPATSARASVPSSVSSASPAATASSTATTASTTTRTAAPPIARAGTARIVADALIVRDAPNGQDTGNTLVQGNTVRLTGATVLSAGRNWSELSDGNWVASDYLEMVN